ncbi:nucleoside-diphosphate-sugar epimerase [Litorivivens lipolytica]|uniref:Nucleoside-diphosphate-sugar epimerase n=1 Tax=Litorivivens lipolytica TaxID=1524264 RepID=A0A7W4Z724_9GAMM|nr:NAD(P)H-binding protein [Litorivivens lipolytica]MBB3048843.1 nucleoside-diphosphate-sugar epimerase [Litorivivens lipolytica]
MEKTLLLIGCGQLGSALGQEFLTQGWRVVGARRSVEKLPKGFEPLGLDFRDSTSLNALSEIAADYVVVTLTPGERSAEAYKAVFEQGLAAILRNLNASRLKRLLFTSSTSVYHQNDGSVVDENSVTEPTSFSGQSVLAAEKLLAESALPTTVVRYGGIYGGDSLRLAERVREGRCAPPEPEHFSNRIHRDDCVAVLKHFIECVEAGKPLADCYLAVDDNPAPIAEVHQWLAAQLGVSYECDPGYRHMAGSKRGNNQRLKDSGFTFRYPDYQQGYAAVLER